MSMISWSLALLYCIFVLFSAIDRHGYGYLVLVII